MLSIVDGWWGRSWTSCPLCYSSTFIAGTDDLYRSFLKHQTELQRSFILGKTSESGSNLLLWTGWQGWWHISLNIHTIKNMYSDLYFSPTYNRSLNIPDPLYHSLKTAESIRTAKEMRFCFSCYCPEGSHKKLIKHHWKGGNRKPIPFFNEVAAYSNLLKIFLKNRIKKQDSSCSMSNI